MKQNLKFWIPIESKDRMNAIKREFDAAYDYEGSRNPLEITEEPDCYRIEIKDIQNIDLIHLFHAGINYMQTKLANQ